MLQCSSALSHAFVTTDVRRLDTRVPHRPQLPSKFSIVSESRQPSVHPPLPLLWTPTLQKFCLHPLWTGVAHVGLRNCWIASQPGNFAVGVLLRAQLSTRGPVTPARIASPCFPQLGFKLGLSSRVPQVSAKRAPTAMAHRPVGLAINYHDVLNALNGLSLQLSCARHLVRDEALHQAITSLLHRSFVPTPTVLLPLGCSTRGSMLASSRHVFVLLDKQMQHAPPPAIATRSPTNSHVALFNV